MSVRLPSGRVGRTEGQRRPPRVTGGGSGAWTKHRRSPRPLLRAARGRAGPRLTTPGCSSDHLNLEADHGPQKRGAEASNTAVGPAGLPTSHTPRRRVGESGWVSEGDVRSGEPGSGAGAAARPLLWGGGRPGSPPVPGVTVDLREWSGNTSRPVNYGAQPSVYISDAGLPSSGGAGLSLLLIVIYVFM